ncbi:predicted protein [Botrytis cinerea T4]|uniref:Uncharacterized protein n=1 Tax=Botryotinia fuckeliana (strain T4) TaxID=999810 RepID=G2Y3L8_BOTF4|nr:predicted protein [Botrytis cinerea T4]
MVLADEEDKGNHTVAASAYSYGRQDLSSTVNAHGFWGLSRLFLVLV